MAPRASDARDPLLTETLVRHRASWAPVFVARAAHGFATVLVVSTEPAGEGSVALLAPTEASALLKRLGDSKAAARVAGTATPGSVWAVGLHAGTRAVWAQPLASFLAG